jgi:N-acetylneuraminic acid mutarotase
MKKVCIPLLVLLLKGVLFLSCEDDGPGKRDWPGIKTLEVTNISEKGAQFNAEIIYRGDYRVLKYGFVWSESDNPSLNNTDRIILSSDLTSERFSAEIPTTLKQGKTYWVKSFVETADYTVYGEGVSFKSLGSQAPVITSFSPGSGSWNDTIKISGEHFSFLSTNNVVMFGTKQASIISVTDSMIITTVPAVINNEVVAISVSIFGNKAVAKNTFTYLKPKIIGLSSLSGTFGDTITILGNNFGRVSNEVYFNTISAHIATMDNNFLKVVVPIELNTHENIIKVISSGFSTASAEPFRLNPPTFNSYSQDSIFKPNEVITIYGMNFNAIPGNNKVQVDGYDATILESSGKHIMVYLPDLVIPEYNVSVFKSVSVLITVAGQSCSPSDSLHISWHSTWTRKKDFPGFPRHNAVAFEINGKGYFGTGLTNIGYPYLNDFWEYDPATDQWTQIAGLPGDARASSVAFTINNKGYVGLGTTNFFGYYGNDDNNYYKDFYRYDPLSGFWTRIADFQGVDRYSAAAFTNGDVAYVGTGWWGDDGPPGSTKVSNDFWKFDPLLNSWTQIQNFPTATSMAVGFTIDTTGYVYHYNTLYRLKGSSWEELQTISLKTKENIAFSIMGKAYFGLGKPNHSGGTNALWEQDPGLPVLINRSLSANFSRWGSSSFVINDKAYIVGGGTSNGEDIFLKDVWEFDPSKPSLKR